MGKIQFPNLRALPAGPRWLAYGVLLLCAILVGGVITAYGGMLLVVLMWAVCMGGLCLLLGGSGLFLLVFQHSLLVISGGFSLGKGDGTGGASGQAVAKAVAVVVPHQLGLAVHKADGTLVAGGDAGTAAVAFFFVYMNDFADHGKILLALMF